jgi:hypothetical protein
MTNNVHIYLRHENFAFAKARNFWTPRRLSVRQAQSVPQTIISWWLITYQILGCYLIRSPTSFIRQPSSPVSLSIFFRTYRITIHLRALLRILSCFLLHIRILFMWNSRAGLFCLVSYFCLFPESFRSSSSFLLHLCEFHAVSDMYVDSVKLNQYFSFFSPLCCFFCFLQTALSLGSDHNAFPSLIL